MKFTTVNIIQIVVAVLVGVLAIAGVIYGVLSHSEPGIMKVCWIGGVADYDASRCSNPEELTWDRARMPLVVGADDDSSVRSAIDIVNSQVGCAVLELDTSVGSEADVVVSLDATMLAGRDHPGGATSHSQVSEIGMQAYVETMGTANSQQKMRVLVHEFGHVLGLAHDDYERSIMFPTQTHSNFTMFSGSDRALLNDLYCD